MYKTASKVFENFALLETCWLTSGVLWLKDLENLRCWFWIFLWVSIISLMMHCSTNYQRTDWTLNSAFGSTLSQGLQTIRAGTPQGWTMSPILFLPHINDLRSSTSHPIHSVADHSTWHSSYYSIKTMSTTEPDSAVSLSIVLFRTSQAFLVGPPKTGRFVSLQVLLSKYVLIDCCSSLFYVAPNLITLILLNHPI